jgi:hypothetical protein
MERPVLWIVIVLAAIALPLVAKRAYEAGRRAGGRKTMPWRPIFQLVDHRSHCLGHDPERVKTELGALFPLPPVAWERLLGMRRPSAPARPRSAAGGRR